MIILSKLECEKWACPIPTAAMVRPHIHLCIYIILCIQYIWSKNLTIHNTYYIYIYRCHADKLLLTWQSIHTTTFSFTDSWFQCDHIPKYVQSIQPFCVTIAFQQQQKYLNTITCTRPAHVSINTMRTRNAI